MNSNPDPPTATGTGHQQLRRRIWLRLLVCPLAIWALAAYLVGGDLWHTDGRLAVVILRQQSAAP